MQARKQQLRIALSYNALLEVWMESPDDHVVHAVFGKRGAVGVHRALVRADEVQRAGEAGRTFFAAMLGASPRSCTMALNHLQVTSCQCYDSSMHHETRLCHRCMLFRCSVSRKFMAMHHS